MCISPTPFPTWARTGFASCKIAFLGNFDPKKFLQMQKRNPELSPDEFQYLKDHATLVSDFGMSAGPHRDRFAWDRKR